MDILSNIHKHILVTYMHVFLSYVCILAYGKLFLLTNWNFIIYLKDDSLYEWKSSEERID